MKNNYQKDNNVELIPIEKLTPTELIVVKLVATGMTNRGIAEQLHVAQRTIESHVHNMLSKINLHNRTELAYWAIKSDIA